MCHSSEGWNPESGTEETGFLFPQERQQAIISGIFIYVSILNLVNISYAVLLRCVTSYFELNFHW
jgi:hypothetical protein